MKPLSIIGIVLAVVGAVILFRGLNYGSERTVLKVGDLQVTAEDQRTIPTWVGGVAIVGGLVLVVAGAQGRRSV